MLRLMFPHISLTRSHRGFRLLLLVRVLLMLGFRLGLSGSFVLELPPMSFVVSVLTLFQDSLEHFCLLLCIMETTLSFYDSIRLSQCSCQVRVEILIMKLIVTLSLCVSLCASFSYHSQFLFSPLALALCLLTPGLFK